MRPNQYEYDFVRLNANFKYNRDVREIQRHRPREPAVSTLDASRALGHQLNLCEFSLHFT